MSNDKIMTLHPEGKQGVNLAKDKYDAMRAALLAAIPDHDQGIALQRLPDLIRPTVPTDLFPTDKGLTWHVMTVKQDLEARHEIEQVPGRKPQHLRRTKG